MGCTHVFIFLRSLSESIADEQQRQTPPTFTTCPPSAALEQKKKSLKCADGALPAHSKRLCDRVDSQLDAVQLSLRGGGVQSQPSMRFFSSRRFGLWSSESRSCPKPCTLSSRKPAHSHARTCPHKLANYQPYRFASTAQQSSGVAEICTEYLELSLHLLSAMTVDETSDGRRSVLNVFSAVDVEAFSIGHLEPFGQGRLDGTVHRCAALHVDFGSVTTENVLVRMLHGIVRTNCPAMSVVYRDERAQLGEPSLANQGRFSPQHSQD